MPAFIRTWKMPPEEILTQSSEETTEFGRTLAARLRAPVLVLLKGDLGAGKTTLTKGIISGLGAAARFQNEGFAGHKSFSRRSLPFRRHARFGIDRARRHSLRTGDRNHRMVRAPNSPHGLANHTNRTRSRWRRCSADSRHISEVVVFRRAGILPALFFRKPASTTFSPTVIT
jgi:hypothetical protein